MSQKSSPQPPETLCNIFTESIFSEICQVVANLYPHIYSYQFWSIYLNRLFNKMALIFLRVLIVFNVSSFSILANRYLPGWLLIFELSTLLKLNFFSLAFHNNLPKLISANWLLLTLLATLVIFLMNTSSLTKYLLSLNLAIIIFINSTVFVLSWLQNCLYHRHLYRSKLDYCKSQL